MQMDPKMLVLLVIVVVAVIAIALILMQRRKAALRQRFGSEYDRVVREGGSERKAQSLLQERGEASRKVPYSSAERGRAATVRRALAHGAIALCGRSPWSRY
jgi:hypothetical protein